MAINVWESTADTAYSTNGNWSLGAVPVATNDVVFTANAINVVSGLAQSAVALASFSTDMSYTGEIGAAGTYLEIDSPTVTLGLSSPMPLNSGSPRINLNLAAVACAVTIMNTATTTGDGNATPVQLLGSALTVTHLGGAASAAWNPSETAVLASLTLQQTSNVTAPSFYAGPSCTLTAVAQYAGTLLSRTTATVPAATIAGGVYTHEGTGAHTALTVLSGAMAVYSGTGTITTLDVAGTFDLSQGSGSVTVTNPITLQKGATINDPLGRLPVNTQFTLDHCTWKDVTVVTPYAQTWKRMS